MEERAMTLNEALVLAEQALSDARILDEAVVGSIEPVDPYDIMLICGYYANLPQYHVDTVYRRDGKNYVDVSFAGRSAFEPADIMTYQFEVVERSIHGEDVEVVKLTEVEWSDGTKKHLRGEEP
jgi:hypothetical protein